MQHELAGVGDLVGGDHPGPERAAGREILAGGERVVELIVAVARLVGAGVAGDVLESALARDVPARLADDEGELAFVIVIA